MRKNSLNLSGKIDNLTLELIEKVNNVAESMSIPFFIVGATARDIIFFNGFGILTTRATNDIDLAVQIADWGQYETLKQGLIATGRFESTKEAQRLNYNERLLIDIVPFGAILDKDVLFSWPPDHETIMNAIGFKESFEHSIIVRLRESPLLDICFASLPGLAIMKLISWDDRYPERSKDAKDLCFIIRNYLDAGNEERLFEEERDIIEKLKESGEVDYVKAGARMLGRDIAVIAASDTKIKIEEILGRETGENERYRLVENMIDNSLDYSRDFEENLESLEQLKLGVLD